MDSPAKLMHTCRYSYEFMAHIRHKVPTKETVPQTKSKHKECMTAKMHILMDMYTES